MRIAFTTLRMECVLVVITGDQIRGHILLCSVVYFRGHHDLLDGSDTRRGRVFSTGQDWPRKETIHCVFGTLIAVLAGDFMFAQSSWYFANLDNQEVIKLISQVIKDFVCGK